MLQSNLGLRRPLDPEEFWRVELRRAGVIAGFAPDSAGGEIPVQRDMLVVN